MLAEPVEKVGEEVFTKPTVLEGTTSIMIGRIFIMWLCPRIETHDGSRKPCVIAGHSETAWLPWQYVDV